MIGPATTVASLLHLALGVLLLGLGALVWRHLRDDDG